MIFNKKQMKEIELGKKSGVDVEIYAKPEFDARQMNVLRLSLEDGIDAAPYARPELPARVMDNARICLKRGKDILKYLDKDVYEPSHSDLLIRLIRRGEDIKFLARVMDNARICLKRGKDILKYLDKDVYEPSHSDLLIRLIRRGEDIKFLEDPRFTRQQRRIIMQGIKEGVPAAFMPKPDVPEKDMKASFELMKTAKTDMVDLNTYVPLVREEKDVFDYRQKEVISLGERKGLDTSVYAKKCFSALQMRRILDGLKRGIDVSIYARPEVSVQEMGAILNVISKEGVQALEPYMKDFTAAQLGEIALGMIEKVDYTVYAKPELEVRQMRAIRMGLREGMDMTTYTAAQLGEIALGMIEKVDYTVYAKPELEVRQMRAIRMGLREGMDMTTYTNENIEYKDITDRLTDKQATDVIKDRMGNSVKKMKLF